MFSLGLVLCELKGGFGSGHERAKAFDDVRNGRWAGDGEVDGLIRDMTNGDPVARPDIKEVLRRVEAMGYGWGGNGGRVERLQEEVRKRDVRIEELEEELKRLKAGGGEGEA